MNINARVSAISYKSAIIFNFVNNLITLKIKPEIVDTSTSLREIDLPDGKKGMLWRIGTLLINVLVIVWWTFLTYKSAVQRTEFYIDSYGEDALDLISKPRLIIGSSILIFLHIALAYIVYRATHRSIGISRAGYSSALIHRSRMGLEPFLSTLSFMLLSLGSIGFLSDLPEGRILGLLLGATAILGGIAFNLISPIVVASSELGFKRWPFGLWLPLVRKFPPGSFARVDVVEIRRNGYITAFRLKAISVQGVAHQTVGVVPAALGRTFANELALRWSKLLC